MWTHFFRLRMIGLYRRNHEWSHMSSLRMVRSHLRVFWCIGAAVTLLNINDQEQHKEY